jgi:uncharacterized membrane protein
MSLASIRRWLLPEPDSLVRADSPVFVPWLIHGRLALIGAAVTLVVGIVFQLVEQEGSFGHVAFWLGVAGAIAALLAYLPHALYVVSVGSSSVELLVWRVAMLAAFGGLIGTTQQAADPGTLLSSAALIAPFVVLSEYRRRKRRAQRERALAVDPLQGQSAAVQVETVRVIRETRTVIVEVDIAAPDPSERTPST